MLTRVVGGNKDKSSLRDLCEHENAAMSEHGRVCNLELKHWIRAYRARPSRTGCRRCTAKRESVFSKLKLLYSTRFVRVALTPGNFFANSYARLTSSDWSDREFAELLLGSTADTQEQTCYDVVASRD